MPTPLTAWRPKTFQAAAPFTPADIPNLVFHTDARSGVYVDAGTTPCTDGQTVYQWNDDSGEGNHLAQSYAGARPTYRATGLNGLPSVEYGEDIFMATASFLDDTFDTAASMFFIGDPTAGYVSPALGSSGYHIGNEGALCRFDCDGLGVPVVERSGVQEASGVRIVGVSYDGAILRTMVNGHLIKYERTGDLGLSGILYSGRYPVLTQWYRGYISELYLWKQALDDSQMRGMCNYLLSEWSLSLPSPRQAICCCGDSLTYYTGSNSYVWPLDIAGAMGLAAQSFSIRATPGVMLSWLVYTGDTFIDPMIDLNADTRLNVIWAGTNDCAFGDSGATVYAAMQSYCADRRAAGWNKILVLTMLPRSAAGDDADTETNRQAFNTLLRAGWSGFADALCDVAADSRIGDYGDEEDATYYAGDNVHLNEAGQGIIADPVQPYIESLLA